MPVLVCVERCVYRIVHSVRHQSLGLGKPCRDFLPVGIVDAQLQFGKYQRTDVDKDRSDTELDTVVLIVHVGNGFVKPLVPLRTDTALRGSIPESRMSERLHTVKVYRLLAEKLIGGFVTGDNLVGMGCVKPDFFHREIDIDRLHHLTLGHADTHLTLSHFTAHGHVYKRDRHLSADATRASIVGNIIVKHQSCRDTGKVRSHKKVMTFAESKPWDKT